MPEDTTIWLKNEKLPFEVRGENRGQGSTVLKLEDDGSIRAYCLQIGLDGAGNERITLVEDDATTRMQVVLWETGTPGAIRWRAETAEGEACISLYGQDEANNLDPLRTDPNRIQWNRPYSGYVQVDPIIMAVGDGILWNPGAAAAETYEVSFLITNVDGGLAPITVAMGVDVGAGGGLAAVEQWVAAEVIPYPGTSGWRGPFIIAGDDDIRGFASVANAGAVHWRIRRVDVGA